MLTPSLNRTFNSVHCRPYCLVLFFGQVLVAVVFFRIVGSVKSLSKKKEGRKSMRRLAHELHRVQKSSPNSKNSWGMANLTSKPFYGWPSSHGNKKILRNLQVTHTRFREPHDAIPGTWYNTARYICTTKKESHEITAMKEGRRNAIWEKQSQGTKPKTAHAFAYIPEVLKE